jgi:alpha-N-arabinofuranosidase
MKLFVSEWNAQSTDWRTGLYCGGILNTFERDSDIVAMTTPALWLRHVTAPSWDNAFINFDSCGWFPAPNYVVMKLWRDHFAPNLLVLEGDTGPLNINATKGDDLTLKVVNPSANAVPVELNVKPGFTIGHAEFVLVNPGSLEARNSLANPNQVHSAPAAVEIVGPAVRFTMPPLSAGVITLREKNEKETP